MSDLHPEGYFNDCTVEDHGWEKNEKTGNLSLWVQLRTEHGSNYAHLYFTQGAAENSLKKLLVLGYKGDPAKYVAELADGTALRGNVVQLQIIHEEWDGKIRAKVGWINKNNASGGMTRLDASEVGDAEYSTLLAKMMERAEGAPF